jgi:tripartite-type tricarboxylate transporter receptor subunit TctC
MNIRRQLIAGAAALSASASWSRWAYAQSTAWPSKPINALVGYPAGGGTDVAARSIEPEMRKQLGQAMVITNAPGAAGTIAMQRMLAAPRDGYTVAFVAGTDLILMPWAMPNPGYALRDVKLVGVMLETPFIVCTRPDSKAATLDELAAQHEVGRKAPVRYASFGDGSQPHLIFDGIAQRLRIDAVHVPYKGMQPVAADLAGGHIDVAVLPLAGPLPGLLESGKLKPIAAVTRERLSSLPAVPSVMESKRADLGDVLTQAWFGLVAPADTPADVLERLNRAFAVAVASAPFQEFVRKFGGIRVEPLSLKAADDYYRRDTELLKRLFDKLSPPRKD